MTVAEILGREAEVADAWAERFVFSDPPRLAAELEEASQLIYACFHVSRPRRKRCLEIMEARMPHSTPPLVVSLVQGMKLAADGDAKGAVRVLRPWTLDPSGASHMPVAVFDEAGELELAEKLDENMVAQEINRVVKGYGAPDLRMARRAWKRGDKARARVIAKRLVAAWSSLDTEFPYLDELRKMAAD